MIIKNSLVVIAAVSLFILNVNSYGNEESATIDLEFQNAVKYDKNGEYLTAETTLKKLLEKKEVDNHYAKACFMLANYYFESRNGIMKDTRKAKKYYNLALKAIQPEAETGYAEAEYITGICILNATRKRKVAFKWLLKSAKNGYAEAQTAVALSLFKGKGVKQNAKTAIVWLKKAVANDSMEAKAYLASYYLSNRKNLAEGIKLAKESSETGNAAGQFTLGLAYQKGRGVAKNTEKAMELFRLAAAQGQKDALTRLKLIEHY